MGFARSYTCLRPLVLELSSYCVLSGALATRRHLFLLHHLLFLLHPLRCFCDLRLAPHVTSSKLNMAAPARRGHPAASALYPSLPLPFSPSTLLSLYPSLPLPLSPSTPLSRYPSLSSPLCRLLVPPRCDRIDTLTNGLQTPMQTSERDAYMSRHTQMPTCDTHENI